MNYLTYERYLKRGGKCELPTFERYKHRVFAIINNVTFGRVKKMKEIPSEVECLCCDLIDYLSANATNEKIVASKSQSAGSVSESESYEIKSSEEQTKEIDQMVVDYLFMVEDDTGTPLLYRGCGV